MPASPSVAKAETSPVATAAAEGSAMRALVGVDANDAASGRLLETLSELGYALACVHDGHEAWRRLGDADSPRLALLQCRLPGMDGIEVCRELRRQQRPAYVYVILLTSASDPCEAAAGLDAGADGCLPLQAEPELLRAQLHAAQRILNLQEELISAREALREQAMRDSLTLLWNHGAIVDLLARELERSQRNGTPVGVIMADLDHFKGINDTRGHLTGDQVLRQVARRLESCLRPYDSIGRYGGEEFLIVLPGCDTASTLLLADRLRKAVSGKAVAVAEGPIPLTVSLGVSSNHEPHAADVEALLRATDTALYRAKNLGRNRIERATAADVWGRLSG